MRKFNKVTRRRGGHDHDRAARRDLARHPERAASALRGEGDAVDRHLFGRRLDLGQCARHGPSGGLGRRLDPLAAGDAGRRLGDDLLAHREHRPVPPCRRRLRPVRRGAVGELDIVDNAVYRTAREIIKSEDFPTFFAEMLEPDKNIGLFYGHLSTAPGNFLEDMIVYRYDKVADAAAGRPAGDRRAGRGQAEAADHQSGEVGQPVPGAEMVHRKDAGAEVRELHRGAHGGDGARARPAWSRATTRCTIRCRICSTTCRTRPTSCTNISSRAPPIIDFIAEAREILRNQTLPVLNASVRIVHKEDVALTYAPEPAYCAGALHQPADRRRRQCQDAGADAGADRPDDQAWRALLPALPAALHGQAAARLLSRAAGLPGQEAGVRSGASCFPRPSTGR